MTTSCAGSRRNTAASICFMCLPTIYGGQTLSSTISKALFFFLLSLLLISFKFLFFFFSFIFTHSSLWIIKKIKKKCCLLSMIYYDNVWFFSLSLSFSHNLLLRLFFILLPLSSYIKIKIHRYIFVVIFPLLLSFLFVLFLTSRIF